MFIRVHNFTLLAMFVIEFIHLFLGPLSSFPRCPSLFSAICPDFSWIWFVACIAFPGGTNAEVSEWKWLMWVTWIKQPRHHLLLGLLARYGSTCICIFLFFSFRNRKGRCSPMGCRETFRFRLPPLKPDCILGDGGVGLDMGEVRLGSSPPRWSTSWTWKGWVPWPWYRVWISLGKETGI